MILVEVFKDLVVPSKIVLGDNPVVARLGLLLHLLILLLLRQRVLHLNLLLFLHLHLLLLLHLQLLLLLHLLHLLHLFLLLSFLVDGRDET
jgi:hypothetical protein